VGIELLNKTSKSRVVMVLRRFPKGIWSQMELSRGLKTESLSIESKGKFSGRRTKSRLQRPPEINDSGGQEIEFWKRYQPRRLSVLLFLTVCAKLVRCFNHFPRALFQSSLYRAEGNRYACS
jgi:hypothetical protein